MPTDGTSSVQTRTITGLYILALSMVAMLTMTGQVLVQWSLARLQGDSTTVNIAGRQRMLSQKIPRIILAMDAIHDTTSSDPISDLRKFADDLQESLRLWRANHDGLASGSQSVGLSQANSEIVAQLFSKIEPEFTQVEDIAWSVLKRIPQANAELISDKDRADLVQHSDAFLQSMDAIVAQYEREAKQRVSRLQWTERWLLSATLLVLICEGLFIFSPAIASLKRAFQRLQAVTDQLESARLSAEQANRAKTQFLARVSHELRTPLHAIHGMLGLMCQDRLHQRQKQRAELAYNASRTLRHMVDDLLDLSSAESGAALSLQVAPTNVTKVVKDCIKLMMPHAGRKGLRMFASSELTDGTYFLLDEYRLRQILINLLQNAIRYTSKGEIECHVRVDQSNDARENGAKHVQLHISVRDTGCGIAAADRVRIFENFVRVNPHEAPQVLGPRLGLGLPITAALVTAMQGQLLVDSQIGEGSTFSIGLPTTVAAMPHARANGKSTGHRQRRFRGAAGITALVVDDAKVNRYLLRDYVSRLGGRTISTSSLDKALAAYRLKRPRLILLDLHVGQRQSLELARWIRNQPEGGQAIIYIITADCHFTEAQCPPELNINGVLQKPLAFEDFAERLQPVLGSRCESIEAKQAAEEIDFDSLRTELRAILAKQLPDELARINEAYQRHDFAAVQFIAHRLRGAAANANWTELAEALAKLEVDPHCLPALSRSLADAY